MLYCVKTLWMYLLTRERIGASGIGEAYVRALVEAKYAFNTNKVQLRG
jgi:hypothetical protein